MSLKKYKKKRDFKKTPEPKGVVKKDKGQLKFVVQKHDARNLHYDLRLEVNGVLKSWAVPKGPSMKPSEKRLAVMTENHPMNYRKFEGVIPEGNYGAGVVMVWDEGTYSVLGCKDKKESEKAMKSGLKKGAVAIVLNGKKLKGGFSLAKMKGKNWLLIKRKDEYVSKKDILKKDKSVLSGKTM